MNFSWKLLVLAAVIALMVPLVLTGGGSGPSPAFADVTDITSSDSTMGSGEDLGITVTLNTTNGTSSVVVDAAGENDDTTATLTVVDCNPDCTAEEGESGTSVSIAADNVTQLSLTLTATCPEDDTITVTADQGAGASDSVEVACDNTPGAGAFFGLAAVAVTASPNVIPCGGTALITATARDPFGHVIPGVGFHFSTDIGTLVMGPPNTAHQIQDSAILSFAPGLPPNGESATVRAWVGGFGAEDAEPGFVLVQQFCPGVTTDSSTAPGLISLTASSPTINCGEAAFVGARVRDSKNQVPPDGTVVNFIAAGGTLAPTSDATVNGVLNVMFTAGANAGQARITAASGDAFGSLTLQVNCTAAAAAALRGAAGTGTGAGGAPAPCVPIGDGVCITPPNTGDGGIKK
jgi:hypothetical protein